MQTKFFLILLLTLSLLLLGCNSTVLETAATAGTTQAETITKTTLPPETTVEPTTVETKPLHSPIYNSTYTAEQITAYFNEVVLSMEYNDGAGDVTLVQKWICPIYYYIYGEPTQEDIQVLNGLFEQLNQIPGFPGIYAAIEESAANLTFHFMDSAMLQESFSDILNGEYAQGATQFWYYTATNEIYNARIGYCTDIDQQTRNSILLEEVINTLGISDTVLRTDSIVYQYSDDNTALSDVDWIILRLLYDPAIKCSMNADDCAELLSALYF